MESEILKLISQSTVHSQGDVYKAYNVLNNSFDKLLVAANGAVCCGKNIVSVSMDLQNVVNKKIKLTFWQKIKKCWKVLCE